MRMRSTANHLVVPKIPFRQRIIPIITIGQATFPIYVVLLAAYK